MNKRIEVAKKLMKIAKALISSKIIKINDSNSVKGYDAYLVDSNTNVDYYLFYSDNWYWVVLNKNTNQFTVNVVSGFYMEDFEKGVDYNELMDNLRVTQSYPSVIDEFLTSLTETIDFYDLIKIFEKYGYDYVGDKRVSNGSKKGLRYELSGNGDYDSMIKEIKEKSNFPEKVIEGGIGKYKYAPEITRRSVIILD